QGNLKLILQGNSPFGGCFRQLEDLQILRFLCLISSFRVLHGRLFTQNRAQYIVRPKGTMPFPIEPFFFAVLITVGCATNAPRGFCVEF
ncbi:hypothetical protein, partial [Rhizobium sp. RHZ02]|uniref:hypothetical protein n=1 Tax=Rhizobium sp. RHZ02 TaxID=2769306 RepID=UPI001AEE5645